MKLHLVNPYPQSDAMERMVKPLRDLASLYELSESAEINPSTDVSIHIPFHSLVEDRDYGHGKQVVAYTHCNPGAVGELLQAAKRADIVTAMSFAGRKELMSFGVDPRKIWVVPCAADKFNYRPFRVLIVGHVQPNGRKRESILLDLAFQYDLTPFEFYIAGSGWDKTASQLAAAGVAVKIVQTVNDEILANFYHVGDVMLVTGYMEGGPLPLLEAMASGCRVLSPEVGYAADYLSEDELYSDASDLMEKLNDLVERGIHNHQLIRSWSWTDYAAEYALLIGRLMGQSVDVYPALGTSRYAQLLDVIDEIKPQRICEIGTWNGYRAIQMLQEAGKFHPADRLSYVGFDLFEGMTGEYFTREFSKISAPMEVVKKRLQATGADIKLIKGDTYKTLNLNIPLSADLYFVDGGHSESTIEHDGRTVLQVLDVNQKAVAVFDDYYHSGKADGVGCNAFIDGLDTTCYEVTHLPNRTTTSSGLEIGMVKVRRNNADLYLQRQTTYTGSTAQYDGTTAGVVYPVR